MESECRCQTDDGFWGTFCNLNQSSMGGRLGIRQLIEAATYPQNQPSLYRTRNRRRGNASITQFLRARRATLREMSIRRSC